MNLIIKKWLLVYVCEHKHNFHVIHFLSLTVNLLWIIVSWRIFPLQISNPTSHKPPLKFGTMPYSYTQMTLQKYFPEMYSYMKKYNKFNTTAKAVKAVKDGWESFWTVIVSFWVIVPTQNGWFVAVPNKDKSTYFVNIFRGRWVN